MDEEPERTKRWEGGYERTWEILKEDETGSLKATIEDILFKAKRKRVFEHHGQVRLGMMRHLYVVVDGSRTMEDQDLKPNRLTCTLKLLEYFVEEYFDQNPISQIGIIVTKSKRAEKLTELSGNPRKHITSLKKAVDMTCNGEPSLYNSLSMAMQTLKHMPGHTSREVLIIFSSLTTCDPSNIYDLVKTLKTAKIRVSVIGLSAEVRVCTVLARETGGTYHVILDETHYKELLAHHVSPPPASSSSECSLIRMGFPQHTIASLSDQDAKPSFSMAVLLCSPGWTSLLDKAGLKLTAICLCIWIIALSQGLHWEAISVHSVGQSIVSFLLNVKYVVLLWCLLLIWHDLIIIYFLWMLFKKSP
ncbi:general transcription factor IIH subunit 2-like protein isoform X2 [Meriones unguiculatus]|uniref:general transcription factor IIH subunit 2-like protein isoform X2 n=1 Tax=Meriones unguiculatus TaxID=10047 RepID=UPI00293EB294|nr:general transcription factor IIH subunit 2-like protein isoform X2 [Meriones unguiculatus]